MRVKNILISVVMLSLAAYGGLKAYMYYKARQEIDMVLAPARMVMQVEYDRIATSVFGPIGIKGLRFRIPQIEEEISFGEVMLEKFDHEGELTRGFVPQRITFTMKEMKMNVSLLEKLEKFGEQARRQQNITLDDTPEIVRRLGYTSLYQKLDDLRELGYEQIVMDLSFDMQFNADEKEATITVSKNMREFGDTSIMVKMADLSRNINSAVLGVKVKEAKLEFTDHSYVERIFRMYAKEHNQDMDVFRKQVIAGLEEEFATKQINLNKDAIRSLRKFLTNPHKLIVTMYPYRPVGVESIKHYKPGDVPMLLNLQIYAE